MDYLIEDSVLSSIADAVRAKAGTSEAFAVTDLASAISNIPSGGGDEDWINYVEGNTTVVSGSASKIRNNAFAYTDITEASFPSCTSIGANAFYSCSNLTSVSFPSCTSIGRDIRYSGCKIRNGKCFRCSCLRTNCVCYTTHHTIFYIINHNLLISPPTRNFCCYINKRFINNKTALKFVYLSAAC